MIVSNVSGRSILSKELHPENVEYIGTNAFANCI